MTDKFEQMQSTVDALCKSMVDTPFKWKLTTHTIEFNGLQLWRDSLSKTWDGDNLSVIFSGQQECQLKKSLARLEAVVSSAEQKKAIRAVTVKPPVPVREAPVKALWWKRLVGLK